MFITNKSHYTSIPKIQYEAGFRSWNHIIFENESYLYMATYRLAISTGAVIEQSALVYNAEHLNELQNEKDVSNLEIYLFSPDELNKSSRWLLEPLLEIKEVSIYDTKEIVTIFILKNGKKYINTTLDIKKHPFKRHKTIFKSTPHH